MQVSEKDVLRTYLRPAFAFLLIYGCWRILAPFAPAIFFAVAIVVSAWPAHTWLLHRLRQRRAIASLLSCAFVAVVVIVPVVLLFVAFRDAAVWLLTLLDEWNAGGATQLPEWVLQIPLIGDHTDWFWSNTVAGRTGAPAWLVQFGEPVRGLLVATARAFGNGLGQIVLAALLLFALFRDGDRIAQRLETFAFNTGGIRAQEMLQTAHRSVVGVMLGVLGTALAQAVVAIAGFSIAGIPNPFLLGALTFILSMAPIGPPLIWGGAAIWLARHGHTGWTIFMVLYGVLGISLIDNVVKPLMISRSSRLPFALTFMGVLGGVIAFGVAGVFIGPAVLAVVMNLARHVPASTNAISDAADAQRR